MGSGAQTVLYGFAFLLLGVPVYVWMRKVEAAARPEPAAGDEARAALSGSGRLAGARRRPGVRRVAPPARP